MEKQKLCERKYPIRKYIIVSVVSVLIGIFLIGLVLIVGAKHNKEFEAKNTAGLSGLIQNVLQMTELGVDVTSIDPNIIEDSFLLVPDLIKKYGYPSEVHTIQTDDGYLLELHRIPYSPKNKTVQSRQPVLLMHGLLDSSGTWVIMGPDKGLAYLLADLGYDVWMANARGNRYSRHHISLNPDGHRSERKRFWDFSWHEVGTTDIPNTIDYILENTSGYEKIHYIGHSQGTTAFFVMGSQRSNYNDKILSMHALAPVAFMSHLRSPFIRTAATFLNTIDIAFSMIGLYEFLPSNDLLALGGQAACRDEAFTQAVCSNVMFLVTGFDSEQLNTTMIPVILGHSPAGASAMNVIHYGQGIRSGHFRQYDHGIVSNLMTYGSISPPNYNLDNIYAPVALYYSLNDWLASPIDVERLHKSLPNVIEHYIVADEKFNHLDFVWAIDAKDLVYNHVFRVMDSVERGIFP